MCGLAFFILPFLARLLLVGHIGACVLPCQKNCDDLGSPILLVSIPVVLFVIVFILAVAISISVAILQLLILTVSLRER